jgi:hypothetical protein
MANTVGGGLQFSTARGTISRVVAAAAWLMPASRSRSVSANFSRREKFEYDWVATPNVLEASLRSAKYPNMLDTVVTQRGYRADAGGKPI